MNKKGGRGCRPRLVRLATLASSQPSKRPPSTVNRSPPGPASPRPARHPAQQPAESPPGRPAYQGAARPSRETATSPTVTGTPLSQRVCTLHCGAALVVGPSAEPWTLSLDVTNFPGLSGWGGTMDREEDSSYMSVSHVRVGVSSRR